MATNIAVTETTLAASVQEALAVADSSLTIRDTAGYEKAASAVKKVKTAEKAVKSFWEPLRVAAKSHYDGILARRKEMMDPLLAAEGELKSAMSAFTLEQERIRQAHEKALRELAEAQARVKLLEAQVAESRGDMEAKEMALAEAEVMKNASLTTAVPSMKPKTQDIAQTKTWKITSVDPSQVPVNFNGAELRPVDTAAVMRLIKATKGTVQIPGVTFEEDVTISVRA